MIQSLIHFLKNMMFMRARNLQFANTNKKFNTFSHRDFFLHKICRLPFSLSKIVLNFYSRKNDAQKYIIE